MMVLEMDKPAPSTTGRIPGNVFHPSVADARRASTCEGTCAQVGSPPATSAVRSAAVGDAASALVPRPSRHDGAGGLPRETRPVGRSRRGCWAYDRARRSFGCKPRGRRTARWPAPRPSDGIALDIDPPLDRHRYVRGPERPQQTATRDREAGGRLPDGGPCEAQRGPKTKKGRRFHTDWKEPKLLDGDDGHRTDHRRTAEAVFALLLSYAGDQRR